MPSPSSSWPPLWLLLLWLLLLSPWPVRAPAPAAATPTGTQMGTPSSRDCPEACACAPGGQVNCSGRALSEVPDGLSPRARDLLLDRNRVHTLPPGAFVGAGALLRLDLRENGLRWVHARAFWGLGALQQLDLGANQLQALAPGTFTPLRALRNLSLAGNRLARLEPAALGALPLLRALSLRDNELSALEPGLLAGLPALRALRLRGNPWACGCALRPLCAWLRGHPRPAPEAETLLCVSPGRLTLSPLTAFPDSAFRHCAQPLAPRDLVVIYVLGPLSFLASLAACLALGLVVTACKGRRQRAFARAPRRRPPNPSPRGAPPADSGSPAAAGT
ncbi:leucine-rich repeat-containing protein 26 [Myotis myotis]|uniref:Leucine rich repeat containing 26 n=1 Tax=Myotis myotis TaxID=51298 RepID=A0A7J7QYS5_MYOMY|nr:leucine-rich repeat-containing protein 26 [Myotis myotis]KAF6269084.1 leucine rich repeat containing 26 [Myotis myotis]